MATSNDRLNGLTKCTLSTDDDCRTGARQSPDGTEEVSNGFTKKTVSTEGYSRKEVIQLPGITESYLNGATRNPVVAVYNFQNGPKVKYCCLKKPPTTPVITDNAFLNV